MYGEHCAVVRELSQQRGGVAVRTISKGGGDDQRGEGGDATKGDDVDERR